MSAAEIGSRAGTGAAILAGRGVAVRAVGLVSTIVLTHYLLPGDVGVLALGMTLTYAFSFLTDGGLGADLIRRPAVPQRGDLQALMAFQLAVTVPVALIAGVLGALGGDRVAAVAIILAGLPIGAFRAPAMIMLERELRFRRVATVELVETVVFSAAQVAAVLLGAGLMGVALSAPLRSLVGVVVLTRLGPVGMIWPRWSRERLRPILALGSKFQLAGVIGIARDQTLNAATIAISGVATLGVWSIAFSVLSIPSIAFESLWRVSFPAVSRIVALGADPKPQLEKAVRLMAVVTGLLMVGVVGGGRAGIPFVFGARWHAAASALPLGAAGLMLGSPISVCLDGYLFATDRARTALTATALASLTWVCVTAATLPLLGVDALGAGWAVAAVVDALVLGLAVFGTVRRILAMVLTPAVLAALAGTLGWVAGAGRPSLVHTLLGGGVAGLAYIAAVMVFQRRELRLALGVVTSIRRHRAPATPSSPAST